MTAAPVAASPAAVLAQAASPLDEIAERTMAVNALNPITGPYSERLAVFKEMAANYASSGIAINGWDTSSKIMTACWMADAQQVHPAIFMQGNYLMEGKMGRKLIEPKAGYMRGLLLARLTGFREEIIESTNEGATVRVTAGLNTHTVTYTKADAVRQGLWDKKGGTYEANSKEMLFKQAEKRALNMIGSHIFMGLPGADDDNVPEPEPTRTSDSTVAATVDAVLANAIGVPSAPLVAAAMVDRNWHAELGTQLERVYGMKKGDHKGKLAKAAFLMSEIRQADVKYDRADHIPPSDAKEIVEFMEKKWPPGAAVPIYVPEKKVDGGAKADAAGKDAPADQGVRPEGVVAAAAVRREMDNLSFGDREAEESEIPLDDGIGSPEMAVVAEEAGRKALYEQDGKIETLFKLSDRAKTSHPGRKFCVQVGDKWYFGDGPISKEMGWSTGPRIRNSDGSPAIEPGTIRRLVTLMRAEGVAL
jgi:hypothetical protein